MERSQIQQACKRLLYDYAWTQDNGDLEGFADIFAPDAVWVRPLGRGTHHGRNAIVESARPSFLRAPEERPLHCISNVRLDINDSGVSSTCYAIALWKKAGLAQGTERLPGGVLIYRNQFKLVDASWKISRHESDFCFRR